MILVRKKDESTRLDNSWLNSVTCKDSHQIPRVDDVLDGLACDKYLSTLNLSCLIRCQNCLKNLPLARLAPRSKRTETELQFA